MGAMIGAKASFLDYTLQDWAANDDNGKGRLLLVLFRAAKWSHEKSGFLRVLLKPIVLGYKVVSQFGFGCDLPVTIELGPRARIYHVHGLVVNRAAKIGADVVLRNGVTIGLKPTGRPGVPIIGDGVEVGSGALLIGSIHIGDAAKIGAGAVVVKDVPAGAAAVGNPARILPHSPVLRALPGDAA